MFCKRCGTQLNQDDRFCMKCGCPVDDIYNNNVNTQTTNDILKTVNQNNRCLASFILGLIGGIFGIFGGFCTTICASITLIGGNAAFILIFCGSILGLVGACLCLNKAFIGSIIELIAAIMIIICAYFISGAEFMSILAFLLFLAGGIIGVIFSLINLKKK